MELDVVGLCWGGDFIRAGAGWQARSFAGRAWVVRQAPAVISYRRNTYRVLLTRARYETILFVPEGDPADDTRRPAEFDAIADFLASCGAGLLTDDAAPALEQAAPQPMLAL